MIEVPLSRLKMLLSSTLLASLACGGGMDHSSFTVEPDAPVVAAGEQIHLSVRPNLDLAGEVEWEILEPYGGGLLRSQGPTVTYVAPEAAGTYHLVLRAPRLDGRPLKQTIAVRVVGSSTLEPGNVRVPPGGSVAFTAHFRGLAKGAVRWSVQEPGGGELTEEGRYTAPNQRGTYHVTATSTVDPTVSAQATVVVEN